LVVGETWNRIDRASPGITPLQVGVRLASAPYQTLYSDTAYDTFGISYASRGQRTCSWTNERNIQRQ
jgi:hypothetical protein